MNNPAAQADRFIDRAGQVTDPKNIYIWAPSNDPVATFTGGYGNDYWNSIKAFPSIFVNSNSVRSSPGSGALGSKTEYVPTPISYPKDDKALNQLQEKHRENMQAVYQQLLDKPKEVPVAKQLNSTQQLQEQIQNQGNKDMNQLGNQNSQNVMMINVPSATVQKIQQLQQYLN